MGGGVCDGGFQLFAGLASGTQTDWHSAARQETESEEQLSRTGSCLLRRTSSAKP
jgi:hypothetical protein